MERMRKQQNDEKLGECWRGRKRKRRVRKEEKERQEGREGKGGREKADEWS